MVCPKDYNTPCMAYPMVYPVGNNVTVEYSMG